MTRNDADMITTDTRIVGTALQSTVTPHFQVALTETVVPPAELPTAYRWSKRLFDILAAGVLLIIFSPLLLLIYIAIKIDDGGPALIIQKRVGLGGQIFSFYKFRSMVVGTERNEANKLFAQQVIRGEITQGPRSNGGVLKPTGNGRVITRVGRLLRKTSLDELPQLFNILNGTMSLVGPRPSMDYEVEAYYDWYMPRLSVLPGITGLAQINGRSSIPFPEIVQWDLKYIENSSFWLDLKILLKTIPVVIGMRHTG
ncbi:MAG: sugar transferase [Chloroflexi bacterium]|nr:sugar transferase [Chloroflexota bacterium]